MKKIASRLTIVILALVPVLYSPPSHAFVTLLCGNSNNPADDEDDDSSNSTALIKEHVTFSCIAPKADLSSDNGIGAAHIYDVEIEGFGIGLRGAWFEAATIICPDVRKSALGKASFTNKKGKVKEGVTEFRGIKASGAVLFGGLDGAVFVNSKGGACILAGIQLIGLGAGVSMPTMSIYEKH